MDPLQGMQARFGGRRVEGDLWTPPSLTFRLLDRPAVLSLWPNSEGEALDHGCRLDVDLRGVSPGSLKIVPEGFFTPIARFFGAQDLSVGDAAFDALYVVRATPASLAASVFGSPRRAEVVAALRALGRFVGPVADLSRDRLRVGVAQGGDAVVLDRIVEAGQELLAAILAPGPAVPPLWDAVLAPAVGRCPVCGTPLQQGLLRCGACRTPHHRECWDYAGGCSTYACGGKHSLG